MSEALSMVIESHAFAATLYVAGPFTAVDARRAIATVRQLPEHIRALCVDVRAAAAEPDALRTLETGLRHWRTARRGMTRVQLPEDGLNSVVALKFPHQRWTRSAARRRPRRSTPYTSRFRDVREAAVTRSLRERVGSETR